MKSEQFKKMIKELVNESLSAQYNSLDKVLSALIAGKITKLQAKKFIKDLKYPENSDFGRNSRASEPEEDFDCSGGSGTFGCGSSTPKSQPNTFGCGSGQSSVSC